jgi:hypothetical protein
LKNEREMDKWWEGEEGGGGGRNEKEKSNDLIQLNA